VTGENIDAQSVSTDGSYMDDETHMFVKSCNKKTTGWF
jgi:hypothetical protein